MSERLSDAAVLRRLLEIEDELPYYDPKARHEKCDEFLSEILELLGYRETVRHFRSLEKWY